MIWKYVGVVIYLIALLGIGVAASRKMKDVKDYFAAGKQLNFWAVAFSARATGESAWLLLGLTGMGAMFGIVSFILAMTVAVTLEGRSVFWFVIFGWSGIAATFCPTIILSLYWKGFTRNGALGAMVSGFLCVPLSSSAPPTSVASAPTSSSWPSCHRRS